MYAHFGKYKENLKIIQGKFWLFVSPLSLYFSYSLDPLYARRFSLQPLGKDSKNKKLYFFQKIIILTYGKFHEIILFLLILPIINNTFGLYHIS